MSRGPEPRAAPWMTAALCLSLLFLHLLLFGWEEPSGRELIGLGARRQTPFGFDDWWRFGTSTFLHASLGHLGGNLALLAVWGHLFERRFGPWLTLLTFLTAGLWSSVFSGLAHDRGLGLGASGAALSFVAWALVDSLFRPRSATWSGRARAWSLLSLLALLLSFRILGDSGAHLIDSYAHLGGILYGGLLGVFALGYDLERGRRVAAAWASLSAAGFSLVYTFFSKL